ncbi:MAG: hypothetical protein FWE45_00755 [Firmicutes bacterium]|nr:hypothetical protein [Bacillota bacterium]
MNAKELKKYNLVIQIGNTDPSSPQMVALFAELSGNDFQTAFEMWEYVMSLHADKLSREQFALNLEREIFNSMMVRSESRTKQLLGESMPLLKLIYNQSATSATAGNLAYLTSLVVASKLDDAGEIMKFIVTNKSTDFAERMRAILDDVFEASCKKSGLRVPSLNRKQQMFLLEYALKVKGPSKNVLAQRIKELG